jgi:hypothetical protein
MSHLLTEHLITETDLEGKQNLAYDHQQKDLRLNEQPIAHIAFAL